jgi:hypothetical protein
VDSRCNNLYSLQKAAYKSIWTARASSASAASNAGAVRGGSTVVLLYSSVNSPIRRGERDFLHHSDLHWHSWYLKGREEFWTGRVSLCCRLIRHSGHHCCCVWNPCLCLPPGRLFLGETWDWKDMTLALICVLGVYIVGKGERKGRDLSWPFRANTKHAKHTSTSTCAATGVFL